MCCFLTILLFLGPRVAGIIWWIVQPTRWNLAFANWPVASWLWIVLGLIFLPFTTIMFVAIAPGGITGLWEWLFLLLAVVIDVGSYTGGGYGNRSRFAGAS